MITLERFSRIVTAVHDSAVEPGRWTDALSTVRTFLGATGCGLICGGPDRDVTTCSVPDHEAMEAYSSYFRPLDYVLDAVESSALGLVHSGESLVALNPRSEFNADWMRPYSMDDGLFVRVSGGSRPHVFLVAAPRGREIANSDNVRAVNALVPHLRQALRTQHTLRDLRDRTCDSSHPADSFSAAALAISADMTVTYTNPAAESLLRCSAELLMCSGRLRLATSAADDHFRRAVLHAVSDSETVALNGDSVLVPRIGSSRPLIIHVLPTGGAHRSALAVVVDPDVRREPPKTLLRQVFSFTDSEAEIALRISRGHGLSAIADELSLSLATVKTHLQHAYQKTDTHRQTELARLVLALMP